MNARVKQPPPRGGVFRKAAPGGGTPGKEQQRLRFSLGAVTDLAEHLVEAREFGEAARSVLYLLLGAVGVPRGMLLCADAAGRLYPVACKGPARLLAPHRAAGNGAGHVAGNGGGSTPAPLGSAEALGELARVSEIVAARDRRLPAGVRALFAEAGLSFALPLIARRRLAGVLGFGHRLDGAPLPAHERQMLQTLARYAAVLLHQHELTRQLRAAVDENLRLCETLSDTYFNTVQAFSTAIDAKDVYTRGHSVRVARYAAAISYRLGLPEDTVAGIRIGAYLHDIGKIVLDRALLNKPGFLTDAERREMIAHPVVGDDVLSQVSFPWPEVRAVVRSHHERVDGKGYPDGLRGEEIPLPARVLAAADAFDAMTTNRPYRGRLPLDRALSEMVRCSGAQFDAVVVRAFLEQCRDEVAPRERRASSEVPRERRGVSEVPRERRGVNEAARERGRSSEAPRERDARGEAGAGRRPARAATLSGMRVLGRLLDRAGEALNIPFLDKLLARLEAAPVAVAALAPTR